MKSLNSKSMCSSRYDWSRTPSSSLKVIISHPEFPSLSPAYARGHAHQWCRATYCIRAIGQFRLIHDCFCHSVSVSRTETIGAPGICQRRYDAERAPSYSRKAALVGPQSKPCPEAIKIVPPQSRLAQTAHRLQYTAVRS